MEHTQIYITGIAPVRNPMQRLLEYYEDLGDVLSVHATSNTISIQFANQRQMSRAVSSPLPFSTKNYIGIRPHPDPSNSGCDLSKYVDINDLKEWSMQESSNRGHNSRNRR